MVLYKYSSFPFPFVYCQKNCAYLCGQTQLNGGNTKKPLYEVIPTILAQRTQQTTNSIQYSASVHHAEL